MSGVKQRAGDFFLPVDAVGVAGERVDARVAAERQRQRQQEFDVAPAAALAAHGDRRLAAGQQHAGGAERLAALRRLQRDAGQHLADIARLAFERIAEDVRGVTPASRATAAAASSAICGVAIMRTVAPARRGSPGLTVSPPPLSSSARTAGGSSMP